jgi:hypothetical protein
VCACVLGMTDQAVVSDDRWQVCTGAGTIRQLLYVFTGDKGTKG